MVKNPMRHKGVIIEVVDADTSTVFWTCEHLHTTREQATRCASRQRDRQFKAGSKNVLAHDVQRQRQPA